MTVKNQHYVPRMYLKNFTYRKNKIYAFDKIKLNTISKDIRKVACEKYFYDVNEVDEITKKKQFIENHFQPLEDTTATVLRNLLSKLNKNGNKNEIIMTLQQRGILAQFIAYQFIRTKGNRQFLVEFIEKYTHEYLQECITNDNPDLSNVSFDINLKKDKHKILHAMALLNPEIIQQISEILFNHIWIIKKNRTYNKFYTSDNPVTIKGYLKEQNTGITLSGMDDKGVVVVFPISPYYIFLLYERITFKKLEQFDSTLFTVKNTQEVDDYNLLQIQNSSRYVFSKDSNFNFVHKLDSK